ncbi:unnamed protein product [Blepharisma stoltei]|uniref:HSF-type DNA-binding domain-containing protein n=1 Tax=Blepharisma stoltei TaxID=1481888 RepID=A0AAU9INL8_9CILI|nr:unnamed protein product [Blepharisma stoltei]
MRTKSNSSEAPCFLQKTFDMLNNEENADIVCWTQDGAAFVIKDKKEFCLSVLPKYFKHSNLASFVRQLNMYDFHKVRRSGSEDIFKHPLFVQQNPDFLKEIKRKSTNVNWPVVSANTLNKPDLAPILQKMMDLHIANQESEIMIKKLEERIDELSTQREVLSMQFWETQERMKQIEHAVVVLASFMHSGGDDIIRYMENEYSSNVRSIQTEIPLPPKKQKVEHLNIEELFEIPHEQIKDVEHPKDLVENHIPDADIFEESLEFLLES